LRQFRTLPAFLRISVTLLALSKHLLFFMALAGLSALVVRFMIGVGVMDTPDARKAHVRPTPKGGGVGVVAAFMAGIVLLYGFAEFSRLADGYFRGVILASGAIAVVAFLDDTRNWPFTVKLGGQVGAALLAVGSGLYVDRLNLPVLGPVSLGWFGMIVTLGWILFATNAMNFIDGLNGLAAGVSALAAAILAGIAAAHGGWFVYFAGLMLAAGLVGFLPFNFPRARIFMGDVGSQFCGFVLAVLAVAAGRFQGVELSVLLAPMLLFGVLYDVAFTLVRRLLAHDRLTQAHRGHLYQVAHRSGLPVPAVTLVHWGFVVWGGACCWVFLDAAGLAKALAPLLVLPPQIAWTAYVAWRARRHPVGRW
jgi:UDP-GlcNAc:undecaprenyl-phosphate GlcNAc-1-phosphate transferase